MQAIEIDGLFNVRASGTENPWLVRSGATEQITESGTRVLKAHGVSVVVDLREPSEAGPAVHGLPVRAVALYGDEPPRTGRLEHIYESLIRERGEALTLAVAAIADADGAALVHCTAGKDRTGLVVALARLAAGATDADVVADYVLSGAGVRAARNDHATAVADRASDADRAEILRLHLDSPVEAIRHALSVIDDLGGAEEYLRARGLDPAQLERLRRKQGSHA
ncbi:MAG: protein-tyrosine-phosphatase [Microbacterium sp.]|uniref:tyrosine-protein phosphatase n=1 Tax=Microbacterium sp. TaxID=51671 RepID=UPI000DB36790|nr:tyrosine-protein phosphatase [Microbacterium sp.]PZU39681.1 MAG: protein-tyrosine-phosphatase [Microbacterium sp.]